MKVFSGLAAAMGVLRRARKGGGNRDKENGETDRRNVATCADD